MEDFMFTKHKELFLNYTKKYNLSDDRIRLKIVHTLAVVDVMKELCQELSLTTEQSEIAYLCALYHDIGRFEQLKRYDTFLDQFSTDHADLGCEILIKEGFLSSLPPKLQDQIITAIRNHNKFTIEKNLDSETLLFSKLTRDADKCDIYRVFATEDMVSVCGFTEETISKQTISPEVYTSIFEHHCVLKEYRQTGLDSWIAFLAFSYDLYFPESMQILMKQQYYRLPFDRTNFVNPETQKQVSEILKEVETYITSKLNL